MLSKDEAAKAVSFAGKTPTSRKAFTQILLPFLITSTQHYLQFLTFLSLRIASIT